MRAPAPGQPLQFEVAREPVHCHWARAWWDVVAGAGRVIEDAARVGKDALDVIKRPGLLDDATAHDALLTRGATSIDAEFHEQIASWMPLPLLSETSAKAERYSAARSLRHKWKRPPWGPLEE